MRESCIQHPKNQRLAIVREDYRTITGDCVSAALLNEFEHLANCAIATSRKQLGADIDLGEISISYFEECLMGITTDKQIRTRLEFLEWAGFITINHPHPKRTTYVLHIAKVQDSIGQITECGNESNRSNNRMPIGQITECHPKFNRSNNRFSLYKKYLNTKRSFLEGKNEPEPEAQDVVPTPEKKSEVSNTSPVNPKDETEKLTQDHNLVSSGAAELSSSEERFKRQYPVGKTGWGVNDWDEIVVDGILQWLKTFRDGSSKTRADAIAYIARRQNPISPEHQALVARVEEIKQRRQFATVASTEIRFPDWLGASSEPYDKKVELCREFFPEFYAANFGSLAS